MIFEEITTTEIAILVAGLLVILGYIAFILIPAFTSYGRIWERLAAGFLTLYILGTLLGIGAAAGLMVIWTYDQYWS